LAAGLAWAAAVAGAQPAAKAPPPAEAFFRDPDIAEAVLSPSGKRLAITSGRGDQRIGLFIIDLTRPGKPRAVAQFDDVDIENVQWVNDDHLLFNANDYSRGSGAPDGGPGLYSVHAEHGRVRVLIKRHREFVVDGDLGSRALDWNHRLLAVPGARPGQSDEDVLVGRFTLDRDARIDEVEPIWLNVRSGLSRPTAFAAPANTVQWVFDSRGEPRLAFTRKGPQQAVHWRGPGRNDWQQLVKGDLLQMPFRPHAVDDAGQLYVLHREGPAGLEVLARYDVERQSILPPLVSTPGFDFEGELVTEPGGAVTGVRVHADAETTVWFDEGMKQLQAWVDQRLPGRVNRITCGRCIRADRVALVRSYSDREPGELWVHRAAPAEGLPTWQAVARLMPGVDARQMAAVDMQRIQARDGRDLPVWLTLPQRVQSGEPPPAVVLVHGGPWVRGGYWRWEPMRQFLASRGYLVIEPEFRGSQGYGEAHYRAGWKQWGQAMQNDVADALLWAQKQGLASQRACIAGASYGGYSTLMGLVRHPELYRCGVAWAAVTDLSLYVSGSWWVRDDISSLGRQHVIAEIVGHAEKDAAMIAANSPVLLAAQVKAPVLLAFGEADLRVPLAHGERMRDALKKAGNDPEWVTYAREGHSVYLPRNQVDFAQRLERFLARHLRPGEQAR